MNIKEYIEKLENKRKSIEDGRAVMLAVNSSVAAYSLRIFSKGLNTQETNIGSYDTKKGFYVNPNLSVRAGADKVKGIEGLKPPTGKTGRTTFSSGKKAGQKHKTTWVNNYKDFRNRIGRRIDIVNMNLSGELKSGIENGVVRKDWNIYELALKRNIDAEKVDGNNKRFGTVFKFSQAEKDIFVNVLKDELFKND